MTTDQDDKMSGAERSVSVGSKGSPVCLDSGFHVPNSCFMSNSEVRRENPIDREQESFGFDTHFPSLYSDRITECEDICGGRRRNIDHSHAACLVGHFP